MTCHTKFQFDYWKKKSNVSRLLFQALVKRSPASCLDGGIGSIAQSAFSADGLQHHSSLRRRVSTTPEVESKPAGDGLKSLELINKAREALAQHIEVCCHYFKCSTGKSSFPCKCLKYIHKKLNHIP